MKKTITIGIILLFLLAVSSGCGYIGNANNSETRQISPPGGKTGSNTDTVETNAIALNENGGTLMFYLLDGINSSLVGVYTANAELTAYDGTVISEDDFKTGQLVTITYDGLILMTYPGQIASCSGIRVIGEADEGETKEALKKYQDVHTIEHTIYYVDSSGKLAEKRVLVIFGDLFGEWKKANKVPDDVRLLEMISEDNAFTETVGETVSHTLATVRDFHLDLSEEFLSYLASAVSEQLVVSSLVKTIIGDIPAAEDTGVFLTVNGSPLNTETNDFSGRLCS